jgi:hypothetical protein
MVVCAIEQGHFHWLVSQLQAGLQATESRAHDHHVWILSLSHNRSPQKAALAGIRQGENRISPALDSGVGLKV